MAGTNQTSTQNGNRNEGDGQDNRSNDGENLTALPEGAQFAFRKCARCGNREMAPEAAFAKSGFAFAVEQGLVYACPQCGASAKILNAGGLFMGAVYSLFWGAAGLWAFVDGPLWYARHISYFSSDNVASYILLDVGVIVFSIAVMALSGWVIWSFLLSPLTTRLSHPVTGENRSKTDQETARAGRGRRNALLSLFVYPLALWVPLLVLLWVLDASGVDLHENKFVAYVGFGAVLGLAAPVGRALGANVAFTLVGMVIWLAVMVGVIFTFG